MHALFKVGYGLSKSYHYVQFQSMTLGFGRWQAQEASVSVIVIVLKTNTRASSSLYVSLNCVLHRFTKHTHVKYIIEHQDLQSVNQYLQLYIEICSHFHIHLYISWFWQKEIINWSKIAHWCFSWSLCFHCLEWTTYTESLLCCKTNKLTLVFFFKHNGISQIWNNIFWGNISPWWIFRTFIRVHNLWLNSEIFS